MPMPAGAPAWAVRLAEDYESGAAAQFVLHGAVDDRLPEGDRLRPVPDWLCSALLPAFQVVFTYDLGNGLRIERGRELAERWTAIAGGAALPRQPRPAVETVTAYLRYLHNLQALGQGAAPAVAFIIRGADQVCPAGAPGHDQAGLVSLIRDWATAAPFIGLPFASILIADSLADLHPLLARNPAAGVIEVGLPDRTILEPAIALLRRQHPGALPAEADTPRLAVQFQGCSVVAVESALRRAAHRRAPVGDADIGALKKGLVEGEAKDLLEFISARRTLADYHGQEAMKAQIRQDAALWRADDLAALPMGYLLCGPVGTGKTFLVECIAGEAGVPVVKLKNFRDKWVGSSEANLEKIFRLVHALDRCMVFVDEADQALGRRSGDANDGGLSGRIYARFAEEMSDTRNRGRVMWLLASSRPDQIEVDLKRPGRIDVKVPLLPTATADESAGLLAALLKRRGLELDADARNALAARAPVLLTPGAAEAVAVKAYRLARTQGLAPTAAATAALDGWQPPVPPEVMEFQMRLAVREASDLAFVPPAFRHLAGGA
ncbi:MAG: hypothetical protein RLZZ127_798 [Planctomycetota bacterium]|jgi:hypothetical protein